jgi:ABC-type phosphate transport system substrate-binding protein
VVAVVSIRSTVTTLSRSQVADIFLGRVHRYPGGATALPIDQAEDSAARDEFYAAFAGKSPAQIKAYWSKIVFTGRGQPPPAAASVAELKRRLAGNPDAIAYIDRSMLDASVREVL